MSIQINRSNGDVFTIVADGVTNDYEAPVALCGLGATKYVEQYATNFLHLAENFASVDAPNNPVTGMLWFDPTQADRQGQIDLPALRLWDGVKWIDLAWAEDTTADTVGGGIGYKWAAPRTLTLSKDATGSVTFDGTADMSLEITVSRADVAGYATSTDTLRTARRIILGGEASGQGSFDGSADTTINLTVAGATAPSPSTIVRRDEAGAVSATSFQGTASAAQVLSTPRVISLIGDVTGTATFDGSSDVQLLTTLGNGRQTGVAPGTYTNPTVTVAADGRITAIGNGTSGGSSDGSTGGSASFSERANTAVRADVATIALSANSAVRADSAGKADVATRADTATRADAASVADRASAITPFTVTLSGAVAGSANYAGSGAMTIATTSNVLGQNVGSGAGTYMNAEGGPLKFRRIKGGAGITVTEGADTITLGFGGARLFAGKAQQAGAKITLSTVGGSAPTYGRVEQMIGELSIPTSGGEFSFFTNKAISATGGFGSTNGSYYAWGSYFKVFFNNIDVSTNSQTEPPRIGYVHGGVHYFPAGTLRVQYWAYIEGAGAQTHEFDLFTLNLVEAVLS